MSDVQVAPHSLATDERSESGDAEAALGGSLEQDADSPRDDDMDNVGEYSDGNPESPVSETASEFYDMEPQSDQLDLMSAASIRLVSSKMDKSAADDLHDLYVEELNGLCEELGLTDRKLLSLESTKDLLTDLTKIKHVSHDCCIKSCIAYTGTYAEFTKCPVCGESRLDSSGQARSVFDYIPITHRLNLQYSDPLRAKTMSEHRDQVLSQDPTREQIQDFCQTDHFNDLKRKGFFRDRRDLAMYLSTEGVSLTVGQRSVWPIILVNMNLPLEMRMKRENVMLVGIIPGSKAPANIGTFLYDLVLEFQSLAQGVDCWDAHLQENFTLRAHICFVMVDQPAASLMRRDSGHNPDYCCQICLMKGIRVRGAVRCPHRPPYDIATVLTSDQASRNLQFESYRLTDLPMRQHDEHGSDATQVSTNEFTTITEHTGVKGLSILLSLPTMFVPVSTPVNIMRTLYEELEPLMWSLWSGTGLLYKHEPGGRARTNQPWRISDSHLAALGEDLEASRATFPRAFKRSLRNINIYHGSYDASDSMVWMMQLSPILLAGRLPNPYYTEWCLFVRAVHELTKPFKRNRIRDIKAQIVRFVEHFERDYYQYRAENLAMCQFCIHRLLHLTDCAVGTGVLTQNWKSLMEPYVEMVKETYSSRYDIDRNLSSTCLLREQLNHVSYACSDFSQRPLHRHRKEQHLQGPILSPAPVIAALSVSHWQAMLEFISDVLKKPISHVENSIGERKNIGFRKIFRYRTQVHEIGCLETPSGQVKNDSGRANYNVRYTYASAQHYGQIQYFSDFKETTDTVVVALISDMEVVFDDRNLLLVKEFGVRLRFIPCLAIQGLIGLVSRDGLTHVVEPQAAVMDE